jgi:ribosome maturation factor RimP
MSRVIEEITPLIESRLKELGYELYDIRFFNAGSHTMILISIDTQKGVSINDC